ncbi:nucleotide exchange factor GrpE [Neobacillus sp. MM2021_6]|uniref:nucleotide exchange factor GrpE n=1 Tax=Bacillaceae TaxID=186817 RepID=UPI001407802B|nr:MULTISPECIES: nucleotide exchange factor GrpE [Bacillaceae]MBO0959443.1 nucleotide exchange factor GrpE [Neobacillus sp. MM2021_6]NHC17259.1 nucleotide exchange factor GrpE [Bacillus sp. MM2020_4]WML40615.1 nucleotide exchange factor GrpE [Neobacillus sp. OS1-2]
MTNEKNNTINEEVEIEVENTENVILTDENAAEGEATENANVDPVVELTKEIQMLNGKVEEAENRYLRLQADFDNFRRRSRLDQEASEKYRAQKLITDLLPALDNFERAMNVEVDNEQIKSLLQGMEMIYRSLLDALKKEGVEQIESVGKEFDPHQHHAVMQGEDENFGSNIVTDELQKGYLLKDRVIRPAMVKVNQ